MIEVAVIVVAMILIGLVAKLIISLQKCGSNSDGGNLESDYQE